MGRPTDYSEELAGQICDRISSSDLGIRAIAKEFNLNPDTIFAWIYRHPRFSERYARAKETQQEFLAEQILDIADDGSNDYMTIRKGDETYNVEDREVTTRSKLRVETRKWLMSKLAPKKFGEKATVDLNVTDNLADRLSNARKRRA